MLCSALSGEIQPAHLFPALTARLTRLPLSSDVLRVSVGLAWYSMRDRLCRCWVVYSFPGAFAAPAAQQATGPSTTPQSCDSSDQPASSSSDRGLPTNTADSPEPSSLSLLTCDVLRQTYKFSPQCGDRAVGDEPSSF